MNALCIGLLLRSDYDPNTNSFGNASNKNPSMEVEVCPWWASGLPRNGSLGNIIFQTNSYELCLQNGSSSDNLTHWPTYVFVSNSNTLSVVNLNLL